MMDQTPPVADDHWGACLRGVAVAGAFKADGDHHVRFVVWTLRAGR